MKCSCDKTFKLSQLSQVKNANVDDLLLVSAAQGQTYSTKSMKVGQLMECIDAQRDDQQLQTLNAILDVLKGIYQKLDVIISSQVVVQAEIKGANEKAIRIVNG